MACVLAFDSVVWRRQVWPLMCRRASAARRSNMTVEQIKGDDYLVEHNPELRIVTLRGTIRLQTSDDYAPVVELLQRAHDTAAGGKLTLDFRQLQFLNS